MERLNIKKLTTRLKVRILAVLDLIFAVVTLSYPVYVKLVHVQLIWEQAMRGPGPHEIIKSNHPDIPDQTISYGHGFGLTEVGVLAIILILSSFVVLQFVAIIKLIQATRIGQDASTASRLSNFWRKVTIVYTAALGLFWIALLSRFSFDGIWVVITLLVALTIATRICGIYFVRKYILELNKIRTTDAENPDPTYNYVEFQNEQQAVAEGASSAPSTVDLAKLL